MILQMQGIKEKISSKIRIRTGSSSKELVRRNPTQARILVEKVARRDSVFERLKDKGVISPDGKLDFDKLETALKKDKGLRKEFYRVVGEEGKKIGLVQENEKVGKAGETITKMGIRIGKTDEILGSSTISLTTTETYNKFLRLGDDLADKFTGGNFSQLADKYSKDPAFRERVNSYLEEKIKNDPELAGLKANQTFAVIQSVRGATTTTRQALWESKKQIAVQSVKTMGGAVGEFGLSLGMFFILSQNMTILGTVAPYATHAMFPAMEAASVLKKFSSTGYPLDYIAMQNQREMLERQGVTSM